MNWIAPWIDFTIERLPELWLRLGEHFILVGVSTLIATLVGIPLGILANRNKWLRGPVSVGCGALQPIPSLAMLAVLLTVFNKIGFLPAITALTLYAFLPIVRNTIAGLDSVSKEIIEGAKGVGMTRAQRLLWVELPLASPIIVTGIRTSAVIGVGIATLSAFIGAGGLGQFINRGLSMSNTNLILFGAIPAILLALAVDASVVFSLWGLKKYRRRHSQPLKTGKTLFYGLMMATPGILFLLGTLIYFMPLKQTSPTSTQTVIRIGSKNFTEQLILGELMAQLIESDQDFLVERHFNLGGTMICHEAMKNGAIDIYAEYTGTGLTAILKQTTAIKGSQVLQLVSEQYLDRYNIKWLKPFGFNNTYAVTIRSEDKDKFQLSKISELAKISNKLKAGFTSEFMEREDGYQGIQQLYNLYFESVVDLEPSIMYRAIANKEVDVICAFATDGRIESYELYVLADDKHFFPPYQAAPIVRNDLLKKFPKLEKLLNTWAGKLNDETMQQLNYQVDELKRSPHNVAEIFLKNNVLQSR